MSKAKLFVISGPSGCGKGTVLVQLLERHPELFYSVSATTRAPRAGMETDGVQYHFLSREAFEEMIRRDGFIEYKQYCDNLYGTPRQPVEDAMAAGRSVILEIETEGMREVVRQYPDCVTVFIAPPSLEVLAQRLAGRQSESEEKRNKRLRRAAEELMRKNDYQYVVVNDALEDAVEALDQIYCAEIEK